MALSSTVLRLGARRYRTHANAVRKPLSRGNDLGRLDSERRGAVGLRPRAPLCDGSARGVVVPGSAAASTFVVRLSRGSAWVCATLPLHRARRPQAGAFTWWIQSPKVAVTGCVALRKRRTCAWQGRTHVGNLLLDML